MTEERMPFYGGQALIEGVMMRGQKTLAIAVRAPSQAIVLETRDVPASGGRWRQLPFVRGVILLWEALSMGWQGLAFSANVAGGEDEKIEGPAAWGVIGGAVVLALGLFFAAPAALSHLTESALHLNPWLGSALEGFIRLILVVGYLAAINLMPDIRRVFAYHGAEHKTINAYEDGADMTPASVARYPVEHPRCGTAFLLTVVVFSVLIFTLLGPLSFWQRLLTRIVLIPVVAAAAYEYIRLTSRHLTNPLVRLLTLPNLALQRLTTREPEGPMLEVAIAAFNAMRARETSTVP